MCFGNSCKCQGFWSVWYSVRKMKSLTEYKTFAGLTFFCCEMFLGHFWCINYACVTFYESFYTLLYSACTCIAWTFTMSHPIEAVHSGQFNFRQVIKRCFIFILRWGLVTEFEYFMNWHIVLFKNIHCCCMEFIHQMGVML